MIPSYIIYYGSYLSFLLLGLIIYFFFKHTLNIKRKIYLTIIFLLTLLFIEARFIEPNMITVKTTLIETGFNGRIAVFSDPHLGIFKGKNFLERVVSKVNSLENIDFVLIPGDFTFVFTENNDFEKMFSPLKNLKVPVYAVLGNHDTRNPGPNIEKNLIEGLEINGVILLNNEIIKFGEINILGLGDNWVPDDKVELIDDFKKEDNLIVLAHNPDTTLKYQKNSNADITISGHTHGGQIRIPYLYKKIIPCIGDFDKGLYNYDENKTFVTSGVGEVGLPLRFLNPPVIDILEFN